MEDPKINHLKENKKLFQVQVQVATQVIQTHHQIRMTEIGVDRVVSFTLSLGGLDPVPNDGLLLLLRISQHCEARLRRMFHVVQYAEESVTHAATANTRSAQMSFKKVDACE